MAGSIKISSDLDARDFLAGTKDMEKALDDVSKDLKDTAKDSDKAVDEMQRDFARAAKAAKDSGTNIGRGVKKGTVEAETATDVYKKEAIANLSEVTSSFTGSWESAADVVQGTLGGVVADLGPIGAAAGAAGALGVGLITASLVKAEEEAERARERIRELGVAIIENGKVAAELDFVVENLKLIVTNAEDAPKKFKDIQKEALQTGLDVDKLATAYAGNADALDEVIKAAQDAYREEQKLVKINGESQRVITEKEIALGQVAQRLIEVQKGNQLAAEAEKGYLGTGAEAFEAKREAISNIDAAYDNAVGSVQNFINQETGLFDIEAYLGAIDARKQALVDYQENVAKAGLTPDQISALNAMGVESASTLLAGWESYTPEQKRRTKEALTEAAKEGSGAANEVLTKAFKDPIQAKVEAIADTEGAERALNNLIQARKARIAVEFTDRYGRAID